jgi:peptide chain release factor 2
MKIELEEEVQQFEEQIDQYELQLLLDGPHDANSILAQSCDSVPPAPG